MPAMKSENVTRKQQKEKSKMSYATVGTIKSINLLERTFKLEPISKYRFEVKDGDETSCKMVFVGEPNSDPDDLKLVPKDTEFQFSQGLESAMVVLKQGKGKIKVAIKESNLANRIGRAKDKDNTDKSKDANAGCVGKEGETNPTSVDSAIEIEVL